MALNSFSRIPKTPRLESGTHNLVTFSSSFTFHNTYSRQQYTGEKLQNDHVRRWGWRSRLCHRVRAITVEIPTRENKGVSKGSDDNNAEYDAIVIGSGIGGLVTATQLAVKGANVLVLEKYVIPGGSSGFYERDGYKFDVGSSVMFGFSDKVQVQQWLARVQPSDAHDAYRCKLSPP